MALDTSACIYYMQRHQPFFALLEPLIERATAGSLRVELSAIVQLELLVEPYRSGDQRVLRQIVDFTEEHAGITIAPFSRDVMFASAQVRAMTRLKLPDALIVGAAAVGRADLVVGNDRSFDRLNAIGNMSLISDSGPVRLPAFLRLNEFV